MYFIFIKNRLLSSIILLFLFNGCTNKNCSNVNAYNGLYNALTCDYKTHIVNLKENTSTEEINKEQSADSYQALIDKIAHKENELKIKKKNLQEKENLIVEIEDKLDNIKIKENTKPLLEKIEQHIVNH